MKSSEKLPIDLFIRGVIAKFNDASAITKVSNNFFIFNNNIVGKSLSVKVIGVDLFYEFYEIPSSKKGEFYLIYTQDTKNDDGNTSEEMKNVQKFLLESFKFKN